VLGWLLLYNYTKRFTLACHFVLGAALALSPVCAALAIRPDYLADPTVWLLGGFVLLWVAGFDIIYALQDIDFDREAGLKSIPAALGHTGALVASKLCHIVAFVMLYYTEQQSLLLGEWFRIGMIIVGLMLVIEHFAASRGRFTMAFFTANGIIACVLGGLGIADVLM